jgi:hypothetical protein
LQLLGETDVQTSMPALRYKRCWLVGRSQQVLLTCCTPTVVAKWRGVHDARYQRCAVFCSEERQKAATTKGGWLGRDLGSGSRRETKEAQPFPAAAQPVS